MGTPVIDPGKTTLYVVAKTITGTGTNAVRNFSLHALDITTGNDLLGGPVIITGTAQSSNGSGTFNPSSKCNGPACCCKTAWSTLDLVETAATNMPTTAGSCLQLPDAATEGRFPGYSRWKPRFDLARWKRSGGRREWLYLRGHRERNVRRAGGRQRLWRQRAEDG